MLKKLSYRFGVSVLALSLASTALFATKITSVNLPELSEEDDLNTLSTQNIRVVRRQNAEREDNILRPNALVTENLSLSHATNVVFKETDWMKDTVLDSPVLMIPFRSDHHKDSRFTSKMRDAYKDFTDEEYSAHLKSYLAQFFPKLLKNVGSQNSKNLWHKTKVENIFVSFGRNARNEPVLLINKMGIGLPIYPDHRMAEQRAFTPSKAVLSQQEKDHASFFVHVLMNKPEQLMDMVSYRSYHPEESLADSQYFFTYGKPKALELPPVVKDVMVRRPQKEQELSLGYFTTFRDIFFSRSEPLRKYLPLFLKNVRDPDIVTLVLQKQYQDVKELQRLINSSSWEVVFKHAQEIGYTESVKAIDRLDRTSFSDYLAKTDPLQKSYQVTQEVKKLINTSSWKAVYQFADRSDYSRAQVQWVNQNRIKTIDYDAFLSRFDWQRKDYETAKKVMHLINTSSWLDVYDQAKRMGFTSDDVAWISGLRKQGQAIHFKNVLARKDPFRKEYEDMKELQFLLNTSSLANVFTYADTIGYPRDNVGLIDKQSTATYQEYLNNRLK